MCCSDAKPGRSDGRSDSRLDLVNHQQTRSHNENITKRAQTTGLPYKY